VKVPRAEAGSTRAFEDLVPHDPRVTVKKVFGQPAAFVNGNMFFGVFGGTVFVRLSEADQATADRTPGFGPFEPMPGRAMTAYRVVPHSVLTNRLQARRWVARSLEHVGAMAPKKVKAK
jgi:TfoX/Sxy family transcriptional regulator of competence genes